MILKNTHKALACIFASLICLGASAEKQVYIPNDFNSPYADDYCNKNGKNGTVKSIENLIDENERWSQKRSFQTENIICFWESGFGTDPTKMVNPRNQSSTFNLIPFLEQCEKIIDHHVNTLHATWQDGKNLNKYKFLFLLNYTTNWMAYGAGYDYTIGAMWLNPDALGVDSKAEYPYFTIAHELFHAMSYQCYSDRPDDTYRAFQDPFNGPFWERSANHGALLMYPNVNEDFARYMYSTNYHFLSSRKHYTTSFFLENLTATEGVLALGEIWKNNKKNEHAICTARRVFFDDDQAKLNDFIALSAMKMLTFDFPEGSNGRFYKSVVDNLTYDTNAPYYVNEWNIVQKKHRTILQAINADSLHFAIRDCQAPQDYGFNVIELFPINTNPDGTADIKIRFKGHSETDASDPQKNSGWRYAFVAKKSNGSTRYGTINSENDKTISFKKEADDTEIFLVVTGAPSKHNSNHNYGWEAGFPKYYRYPYEIRLENALPLGYNKDYEGTRANGAPHPNGGGWVAATATVAQSAYVGPNAKVLGNASVTDNARIEDYAIVKGSANISGNAIIKENAVVFSNAKVYGNAIISGAARVFNNSKIYDKAFVTDNAFIVNSEIYGNAICSGNLWQRDYSIFKIGGTCIFGGDSEAAGYIVENDNASGPETTGTFLQWPEKANNNRTRKDGLGNISESQIEVLRENWNNLQTRFSILNNSISSDKSNPNYDINLPYVFFKTEEMIVGNATDSEDFTITNAISHLIISGNIPENTTYCILNEAGTQVIEGSIYSPCSISIPASCPDGTYTIKIFANETSHCEVILK